MIKRRITLAYTMDEWISKHELEIEESTVYGYYKIINKLKEHFGNIKIRKLTSDMIQDLIELLRERNTRAKTVTNYTKVLRMILNYAKKRGYITSNPFDDVIIPREKPVEICPLTQEEIDKVLSVDCIPWVKDGIVIAYRTGMRKGEIYSLKWNDINFEKGFIQVQRTQSLTKESKVKLKLPKTKSSMRRISIDKELIKYLEIMRSKTDGEYVFPGPNGPYRIPWNLSAYFRSACIQAGVAPRRFHDLRHTHASLLLADDTHPKIVQERLGHSDISMTMDTYSHFLPTMQDPAVSVFNSKKIPGQ